MSSVEPWSLVPIGNTYLWYAVYALILYLLLLGKQFFNKTKKKQVWIIRLFLLCVIISFVHGVLIAEYYWDWKLLVRNLMVFSMPITIFAYSSPLLLKKTFSVWLKYGLLLFPFFLPIIDSEAYGRYLVPLSILLLFYPRFPLNWKMFAIAVIIFLVISAPDSRSNVIKFIVPLSISMLLFVKGRFLKIMAVIGSWLLLGLPFLCFVLAATGIFNPFDMSEYLAGVSDEAIIINDEGNEQSLLNDTRTLLYVEEITSALNNDYWLFGRSMARGYDTVSFIEFGNETQEETGRNERPSSEVSVLNIFNYFGLVGVIIYFLVFLIASNSAITKSNNDYSKLVGLYVAFRWAYAWVEDFSRFDLNYFFLWIVIGISFSTAFRKMTNREFELWLKSILGTKRWIFK
ncbi:hypothetical protein [Pustulibacterium marinum]|uniref:hypothetical protein n=1 Tax=Pustulibacterium marinum TaxID=1224947 RepID=UPI001C42F018|nr:hypothetical protein [Pustulibacterium marinum]